MIGLKHKKKIIAMVLALLMCFGISGCHGIFQSEDTVETEETVVEVPGIGDTVSDEANELTIHKIQGFTYNGRYFLIVDMTCVNLNQADEQDLKNEYFYCFVDNEEATRIEYNDLNIRSSYSGIYSDTWNPLDSVINTHLLYSSSTVQPGRTERGYLVYEYYRPFTDIEIQLGSIHIYADSFDINVVTITEPGPVEETEEAIEEPVPEETVYVEPEPVPEEIPAPEEVPIEEG